MPGPWQHVPPERRLACLTGFPPLTLLTLAIPATAAARPGGSGGRKGHPAEPQALDAYAKQDWETARALLKEALELCASAGLDKHAIRARTHIHFGAVAITGFHQREVGLKQFRKALEVQPDIKLTKGSRAGAAGRVRGGGARGRRGRRRQDHRWW